MRGFLFKSHKKKLPAGYRVHFEKLIPGRHCSLKKQMKEQMKENEGDNN